MTVAPGATLGPYSVIGLLGKGGMGEVYRARDKRLDREVAIKVLRPEISGDRSSRLRLDREAKSLSSLSHPNICAIFDVGHQNGVDYLVMEYLEGITLGNRIRRNPLPLTEALQYGIEIAAALENAHHRGIVHRDLKPGNIMLTKSGVKVLDFGLATRPTSDEDGTDTPTIDEPLTRLGAIVGTIQYMSPEQLEGKEADAQSDIFALGIILYEMLTGRSPFAGDGHLSAITSIMTVDPPPISRVNSAVPTALDRVISVCLAKKPEQRWESARDIKIQLQQILASPAVTETMAKAPVSIWNWKLAAALALLIAVAISATWYFSRSRSTEGRVVATTLLQPPGHVFLFGHFGPPSFSPDGSMIAFVAAGATAPPQIWVRRLDSPAATPLPGSENAYYPFWSPDSRYIAFFAGMQLKKIAASGGSPLTICDANFGRGGAWNRDDQIIFGRFPGSIYRVSASGGVPTEVTKLDDTRRDVTHRWPVFLPDGKHFLYMASNYGPENDTNAIFMGSLDGGTPKLVVQASSNTYYAAGRLFYVRESTIMAQRFDPESGKLSGEPAALVQNVAYDATASNAAFDVSSAGDLAYQSASAPTDFQLVILDSSGKVLQNVGEPGVALNARLSPEGKRVLVSLIDRHSSQANVWSIDLDRFTRIRLTSGGLRNNDAIWSPDGDTIAYSSWSADRWRILTRPADGTGAETTVYQGDVMPMNAALSFEARHFIHNEPISPTSWTPDGKQIVFSERTKSGQWIVSTVPADGHSAPVPLLQASDTSFRDGELSPDGKWIAYESDESGQDEIYMAQFPSLKQKQQISVKGGSVPRWQRNGKALCFLRGDKNITCADLAGAGNDLHVGSVHPRFPVMFQVPFDLTADGQKFVLGTITNVQNPAPLSVVTNWTSRLER